MTDALRKQQAECKQLREENRVLMERLIAAQEDAQKWRKRMIEAESELRGKCATS